MFELTWEGPYTSHHIPHERLGLVQVCKRDCRARLHASPHPGNSTGLPLQPLPSRNGAPIPPRIVDNRPPSSDPPTITERIRLRPPLRRTFQRSTNPSPFFSFPTELPKLPPPFPHLFPHDQFFCSRRSLPSQFFNPASQCSQWSRGPAV
jgi:hypothetical protein